MAMFHERLPPDVKRNLCDYAAKALDGVGLRPRGMFRHDDAAGDAKLTRTPCDALRHVAGTGGIDAAPQRIASGKWHGVRRAAKLPRGDGVRELELSRR